MCSASMCSEQGGIEGEDKIEKTETNQPPTIKVFSSSSLCSPASITRTDVFGSSARRAATTEPDVPPL